jgi:carboxylate-amine ligase
MKFEPSPNRTVGIEWELQLLDPLTLDLADGIIPLMEFFPDSAFVKPEYIQSCVELSSCIASDSAEAVAHLGSSLHATLQRCSELEMSLCGAGTHPFCRRLALITPLPRYQRIEASSGYRGHQQITFSTHVHVGMQSGDEAMRVMSRMIPALPAFVALSSNSPFWRGHDTDHVAYRHQILAASPNYGLPPRFGSWKDFERFHAAAMRAGMIQHFKDIHWDLRPHPDFGTLELRVMDAASDLRTLHGLSAFARSVMVRMALASDEDVGDVLPQNLPHWIEKQNRYEASKHGLEADFVVDDEGNHRPLRDVVSDLVEFCAPVALEYEELNGLDIARDLLTGVPGYEKQLGAYRTSNSARSVVRVLEQALLDGTT